MSIWSTGRTRRLRPNRTARASTTWGAAGVRRTDVRYDFVGRATLVHDGERRRSDSGNVSESGAYLHLPDPPAVGESVRLMLTLDGSLTIAVDAVVRWHEFDDDIEAIGCGVQFLALDDCTRASLRAVLEGSVDAASSAEEGDQSAQPDAPQRQLG